MMFRAVFWVVLPCKSTIILHGSTTQKTALNNKETFTLGFGLGRLHWIDTRMGFKEIGYGSVGWIYLAQEGTSGELL
jgi:hypothetical protein